MRPGDHPEFFRFPAPEGRSRESSIVLDGEGRFWHDGALVEHAGLLEALPQWISRHPDDGRFILTNGYDWTYFTVEDVAYFVRGISRAGEARASDAPASEARAGISRAGEARAGDAPASVPELLLFDGSREPFPDHGYRIGRGGALYCPVKGGRFEARFTPGAQAALVALAVEETAAGLVLSLGGRRVTLPLPA